MRKPLDRLLLSSLYLSFSFFFLTHFFIYFSFYSSLSLIILFYLIFSNVVISLSLSFSFFSLSVVLFILKEFSLFFLYNYPHFALFVSLIPLFILHYPLLLSFFLSNFLHCSHHSFQILKSFLPLVAFLSFLFPLCLSSVLLI